MNLHLWVSFTGMLALLFGVSHMTRRTAPWFAEGGSPEFEVKGTGAVVQGALEVALGAFLLVGSALDYFGILRFTPVLNAVKVFLEF